MTTSNRTRFLYLCALSLVTSFAGFLVAPVETRYVNILAPSPVWVGVVFASGAIFFALVSAVMSRVLSPSRITVAFRLGLLAAVIFPLLYAFASSVFIYIGGKAVWALAAFAVGPLLMGQIQEVLRHTDSPGMHISYLYAAQALMGALAQFLGGHMSDWYGITVPFLWMSATFAFAFALGWWFTPAPSELSTARPAPLRALRNKPFLWLYAVYHVGFVVAWEFKFLFWPLVIFGVFASDGATGTAFATMGVTAFFALLIVGKVIDRLGPVRGFALSAVFLVAAGMALGLVDSLWMLVVVSAVYAVGESLYYPARQLLLLRTLPSAERTAMLSLDESYHLLLVVTSQVVGGFLLVYFSPSSILTGAYVLLLVGVVLSLPFWRQIKALYARSEEAA